ncbi:MAG: hypothetical protein HY040_09585 [Planctomycetes bacterium]|nr:hypothetical protein [Planctomycetota bacterium]
MSQEALDAALFATPESRNEVREALTKAGAKPLTPADPKAKVTWETLAGKYENDNTTTMTIKVGDAGLVVGSNVFRPTGPNTFTTLGNDSST